MKPDISSRFTGWPSRREKSIFLIRTPIEDIAARFGSTISDEQDDLDSFRATYFFLEGIGAVVFTRYAHAPVQGTEVHVDWSVPTEQAQLAVSEVLGLDADHLIWKQTEL